MNGLIGRLWKARSHIRATKEHAGLCPQNREVFDTREFGILVWPSCGS